jgi:hypothetical protein
VSDPIRHLLDLAARFVASDDDATQFADVYMTRFRRAGDNDEITGDEPGWPVCCEINASCDWHNPEPRNRPPCDLDDAELRRQVARHLSDAGAP